MLIVVDEIPDNVLDCKFSEYSGNGFYECLLTHRNCTLCYNRECDQLVDIRKFLTKPIPRHMEGENNV